MFKKIILSNIFLLISGSLFAMEMPERDDSKKRPHSEDEQENFSKIAHFSQISSQLPNDENFAILSDFEEIESMLNIYYVNSELPLLPNTENSDITTKNFMENEKVVTSNINIGQEINDNSNQLINSSEAENNKPSNKKCKCTFPNCGKSFFNKHDLERHETIHTGIKPFACSFEGCGKSFSRLDHQKGHELRHTDERPYECNSCKRAFKVYRDLTQHIKKCNKKEKPKLQVCEKPFKCLYNSCDKSFSKQLTLSWHQKFIHNLINNRMKNISMYIPDINNIECLRKLMLQKIIKAMPKAYQNKFDQLKHDFVIYVDKNFTIIKPIAQRPFHIEQSKQFFVHNANSKFELYKKNQSS